MSVFAYLNEARAVKHSHREIAHLKDAAAFSASHKFLIFSDFFLIGPECLQISAHISREYLNNLEGTQNV